MFWRSFFNIKFSTFHSGGVSKLNPNRTCSGIVFGVFTVWPLLAVTSMLCRRYTFFSNLFPARKANFLALGSLFTCARDACGSCVYLAEDEGHGRDASF